MSTDWIVPLISCVTPIVVALSARITNRAVKEVHTLANNRLTRTLAQVDALTEKVGRLEAEILTRNQEVAVQRVVTKGRNER